MSLLSIVIPVYNEEGTVRSLVAKVQATPYQKEIILVDDASTDNTPEILARLSTEFQNIKIYRHDVNLGKGAALRTAFSHIEGDIVVIQDADLEYDPADYGVLLGPILDGRADVVYGSRFIGGVHRVLFYWHYVGNRFLTTLSNMFSNLNLSDMETCFKVFRVEVLQGMKIRSNRFGFEPEFTLKAAKKGFRIYEVPISYSGRDYSEGKKVTWVDGVKAVFSIIYFRFFD